MKYRHLFKLTEASPSYRIYRSDDITARLDFFEHILRVAFIRDGEYPIPTYTVCPDGNCPREGRDKLSTEGFRLISPAAAEDKAQLSFSVDDVDISVDLMNFRMTFTGPRGVLFSDREYISYNFGHELGRGSMHFITREPDEKIYGLGDKTGDVNKTGCTFKIGASDSMGFDARTSDPLYKQLPFYICENSRGAYGIYYDTYSNGEISFGKELNNYYPPFKSLRINEENLVFYVIFGTVPEILRRFCRMCGPMAFPPRWSFEYCGSTMTYTDAPDADKQLRGFIEQCTNHGIKPGGFYLSSGYTQIGDKRCVFHWNLDKIPSPEGLAEYFSDHGVQFIANIKPAFLTEHPMYDEIASHGWFLHYADGTPAVFPFWGGMGSYLDFTNPEAFDFWTECVKKNLVDRGYKNSWNDNNEYDVCDEEVLAHGFGHPVKACDIRPLFSLLMTMASLNAQDGHQRKMAVSRCAAGGLQRYASTWTGDNRTSFDDFRFNHKMAMTMSLSGFYNFGQDIGGFYGPKPERELFMRWIQYGLFTPRFVLHSWKPDEEPTMPWLYPDLIPAVRRLFDLRRRLIPYLYNEVYRSVCTYDPIIYPVFLKYPGYDPESDCFFFGDSILACPVFDKGAEKVTFILPGSKSAKNVTSAASGGKNAGNVTSGISGDRYTDEETTDMWYLSGEAPGEIRGIYTPGRYTLDCAYDGLPVWFVKAGSVIPYAGETGTEYVIYPLQSGRFEANIFEDDGVSPLAPGSHRSVSFEVECESESIIVRTNLSSSKNILPAGSSTSWTDPASAGSIRLAQSDRRVLRILTE